MHHTTAVLFAALCWLAALLAASGVWAAPGDTPPPAGVVSDADCNPVGRYYLTAAKAGHGVLHKIAGRPEVQAALDRVEDAGLPLLPADRLATDLVVVSAPPPVHLIVLLVADGCVVGTKRFTTSAGAYIGMRALFPRLFDAQMGA